jgi:hypothetical protein
VASQTDIANLCLTILGKPAIVSLSDGSVRAVQLASNYDMVRRKLLEGPPAWRFSVKRGSLPSMTGTPVSGPFTTQYAFPTDCIRPLQIGDTWPGLDLTDYRMGPTNADFQIEGRVILCDYGSPLSIAYVYDVADTTLFTPSFCDYFAAHLAWVNCEALTNSTERQTLADARKKQAMADATASNALVKAPEHPADDTWVLCRLQ